MGDVIGDFNTRRGIVGEFLDKHGGLKLLKAEVPLAEMFQYVSTLRGMTKGEPQAAVEHLTLALVKGCLKETLQPKFCGHDTA